MEITGYPDWVTDLRSSGKSARILVTRPTRVDGRSCSPGQKIKTTPETAFEVIRAGRADLIGMIQTRGG